MRCVQIVQQNTGPFLPEPPGGWNTGADGDCIARGSGTPVEAYFSWGHDTRAVEYMRSSTLGAVASVTVIPPNADLSQYTVDLGLGVRPATESQVRTFRTDPRPPTGIHCFNTPRTAGATIVHTPTGQSVFVRFGSVFLGSGCDCP